jgi:hypothetical protein
MTSSHSALAAVLAVALVTACHEATSPGRLTLAVAPASRSVGLNQDSIAITVDSAAVVLSGDGAGTTPWTATHDTTTRWLTFVTAAGTGSGVVRWVVNPIYLAPGTYVDTVVIAAAGADGSPARVIDSLTVRGTTAQLITMRRAWLPGERDSLIASVQRNHTLSGPYVGDLSPLAPAIFGAMDSVTVVAPNPLYRAPPGSGPDRAAAFASGWSTLGLDLTIINQSSVPYDTLAWLGLLWFNPSDSTWKGLTLAATTATTIGLTTVNTPAFDASGAMSGAGGGEAQQSTGTYWEARSGQIEITFNAICLTNATITSGVYQGGNQRLCFFGGRLVNLTLPRVQGTAAPRHADHRSRLPVVDLRGAHHVRVPVALYRPERRIATHRARRADAAAPDRSADGGCGGA